MSLGTGILGTGVLAAEESGYSAIGTGQIGIAGLSQIETNYRATGIGQISIAGQSLIETNYRTTGVGQIGISGQSLIDQSYKAVGIGQIGVAGLSIIAKSYEAHGIGQIGISGQSLIEQNYRAIGIGQIGIVGLSLISKSLTEISPNWISTHYLCYVVGTDTIEAKIKSCQIRYHNGRLFLSVVIPANTDYFDVLLGRIDDELKVIKRFNYNDGSYSDFVLASSILTDIRVDEGGYSGATITLSAYSDIAVISGNTIDLSSPIYRSQQNSGARRYRCEMDPRLRLGDTANINGDSFTIGQIIHYVNVNTALTEIAE